MQYIDLAATTYALHPLPFLILAFFFAFNIVLMLIVLYRTIRLAYRALHLLAKHRRMRLYNALPISQRTATGYQRG